MVSVSLTLSPSFILSPVTRQIEFQTANSKPASHVRKICITFETTLLRPHFDDLMVLLHFISSHSLNLSGRRGTTDDVATIPFHLSLSFAALRESPNPIPVHYLILSTHLFFCLPLLLDLFTVPYRIVFVMPRILRCCHTI